MLVCARLRHVADTQWGNKKYMNMKHLEATLEDGLRQVLFAKRVPVKQEVKPPVAVWLEQTVR